MVSHETLHFKNKSIFNTLGFIIMIAANALAVLLPINGKTTAQVSEEYPNLFVPAGVTFLIWSVIYLSLLGFIFFQLWLSFSNKQPEMLAYVMQRIKDWFLISSVANACWLFAWHYHLIPVSAVIMLMLLISLIVIHLNFGIGTRPASRQEKLFIHLPFSIYLGWISIATIANITALLVYAGWDGSHQQQIFWTIAMIAVGTVLSMIMILRRNNITYALVSVWAFYGILLKRRAADVLDENSIIHACIIAIGVIAVTISWQLYRKQKS
ncbi:tryptophan-rich sensory protein [Chitinophaga arvensicola]|uniref:TspO/MBR family protein n=1 Tax=Chitinophaga arvensicola TaxID=29529 RepID=A0A1I0S646_9BACT|nr:tryptophan-rich sensory protein [Chitinophaga arvensicola]SEW50900.1 TspO/MBR family protein [Chitinophaga arvensicola]